MSKKSKARYSEDSKQAKDAVYSTCGLGRNPYSVDDRKHIMWIKHKNSYCMMESLFTDLESVYGEFRRKV